MGAPVYFDNAATTGIDPRVAESVASQLRFGPANPSSLHRFGRQARGVVERARDQVAALLHATRDEIVFTASGTEANNLALRGVMERDGRVSGHLVTSAIEHPSILETCKSLVRAGAEVSSLPVDEQGIVRVEALRQAIRPDTRMVSVMTANNVTGVIQPIAELASITHSGGALFHTDAVQAVGKLPFDLASASIDLLSLSGHKFHGPQGTGALFVRAGVDLQPMTHGGGQERGLRSATENVAGLVGLGTAAEIALNEMTPDSVRLVALRDRIIQEVLAACPNAYLIGDRYRRLPGHACFGFAGQEGEAIKLLLALDEEGVAVSSGSACSARHANGPSHVLQAMGFDPISARGSLRISLGRTTTTREVDRFLAVLPRAVASLRPLTTRP